MIHQPDNRYAAVDTLKTSGDAASLAVGQVALTFENRLGARGQQVVDVTADDLVYPKSERFVIQFGLPSGTKVRGNAPSSIGKTFPFSKDFIGPIGVFSPKTQLLQVDKIIIGYNGIDEFTAPYLYPGETRRVTLEIYGDPVSVLGFQDGAAVFEYTVSAPPCRHGNCEQCDPCDPVQMHDIFVKLMKDIKETRLPNGDILGNYIDVELIERCDSPIDVTTTPTIVYEVTLPNICGKKMIDYVQASVDYPVEQVNASVDSTYSTFRFKVPVGQTYTPSDVVVRQGSVLPYCDGTCPDGFDATSAESGFVYQITYKPSINSAADAIANFPGDATSSAQIYETLTRDEGLVQVVTPEKVDPELIDAYIADDVYNAEFQGQVSGICISSTETTYQWAQVDGCEVAQVLYYLTQEVQPCGTETEAEAVAKILADLQRTYPYNEIEQVGDVVNCLAKFSIAVYTNEVCSPCDYTVSDVYEACKPLAYRGAPWYCAPSATDTGNCRVGIKLSGKWMQFVPSNCLRDKVPLFYDSIRLRAASVGGYDLTIGFLPRTIEPWSVQVVSTASEVTSAGFKLQKLVDKDLVYFLNARKGRNYMEKVFKGQDYWLEPLAQYVDYWVTLYWQHRRADGYHVKQGVTYHFLVKFGEHEDIEQLMNALAEISGQESVSASAALSGEEVAP